MGLFPFSKQNLSAGVCETAQVSLDERHSTETQFKKIPSSTHSYLLEYTCLHLLQHIERNLLPE